MDFIEQLFRISPDGGSQMFELLLFLIPILGALVLRRAQTAGGREPTPRYED